MKKCWWKSKTLWLNLVVALLAVAEVQFHVLKPQLGDALWGVAFFAVTVLNVALRFITTQALRLPGEPK